MGGTFTSQIFHRHHDLTYRWVTKSWFELLVELGCDEIRHLRRIMSQEIAGDVRVF
jgi:hypothetical protein